MKINVSSVIKNRGEQKSFSFQESYETIVDQECHSSFIGDIMIDGKITNVGRSLLLEGKIFFITKDVCSRCLQDVERNVNIAFTENFFFDDNDVNEGEGIFFSPESDLIDIRPIVRDFILVEQPIKVLCDEKCKGLCPVCGINLNKFSCDCDRLSIDPRLIELKKYLNEI